MNNYPYLFAGLPELFPDFEKSSHNIDLLMSHIMENTNPKEVKYIDWLIFGLKGENLTSHFYREVFKTRNSYLNTYFRYDLDIRNIQTAYISKLNGTDPSLYLIGEGDLVNSLKTSRAADFGASEFFEDAGKLLNVLANSNILEREQNLDLIRWNKAIQITLFNHFDIDWLLGFVTRLQLVRRWDTLDPKIGAELFKRLVDEVRETYKKENKEE